MVTRTTTPCRHCHKPTFVAITARGEEMVLDAQPLGVYEIDDRVLPGLPPGTGRFIARSFLPHFMVCRDRRQLPADAAIADAGMDFTAESEPGF